jgi:hypothetical protein
MDLVKRKKYLFTANDKSRKPFVGQFVRKIGDHIFVDRVGTNYRIMFESKYLFLNYSIEAL